MNRKTIIWSVIGALVLGALLASGWLLSAIDDQVRAALEQHAATKMGVPVRVGGVNLSLLTQTLHLESLQIGNPEGYQADNFLTIARIDATYSLSSLLGSTFEIGELEISGVDSQLENRRGQFNFQQILENLKANDSGSGDASAAQPGRKLRIGTTRVRSIRSTVSVTQSGLRLPPLQVEIPELVLEELGTDQDNQMVLDQLIHQFIQATSRALLQEAVGSASGGWNQVLRGFTSPGQTPQLPQELNQQLDQLKDLFKKPRQ